MNPHKKMLNCDVININSLHIYRNNVLLSDVNPEERTNKGGPFHKILKWREWEEYKKSEEGLTCTENELWNEEAGEVGEAKKPERRGLFFIRREKRRSVWGGT